MEDADSDSGIDSDGSRHHAGRDIVYGLRTDSYAVGSRRRRKREAPGGDASLFGIFFCQQAVWRGGDRIIVLREWRI